MKLILTGASGFIGSEVLHQTLQDPAIDSVIALTRRPLKVDHPKLKVLIVEDFTDIPKDVLAVCAEASACIWTLGSKDMKNLDASRRVNLDYTIAAAKAFVNGVDSNTRFSFVYMSGVLAVREQDSSPYFLAEARKQRGEVENQLLTLAREHESSLDVRIARPAFVVDKNPSLIIGALWNSLPHNIRVNVLAAATIKLALKLPKEEIFDNAALVRLGGHNVD